MSNVPALMQERGISVEVFSALKNSIFPGATDDSVVMAWDYCAARGLDVMLKPVHLVPMSVKRAGTDKYDWRDVVMPGIGLYRIQADRAGNYAGMDAPVFGDEIITKLDGVDVSFPEWCEITVHKVVGDRVVAFTAREYWIENYATKSKDSKAPNSMWLKRPRGQIVKCTEAQVLRKGWPELGAQPTAEEMEGKELIVEKDITPSAPTAPTYYSDADFDKNFPSWKEKIEAGTNNAERIIAMVGAKAPLTDAQKQKLNQVNRVIEGELQ